MPSDGNLTASLSHCSDLLRRRRADQIRWRGRGVRGTRQRVSVMHKTLSGQAGQRMPCESRPRERQASPRL